MLKNKTQNKTILYFFIFFTIAWGRFFIAMNALPVYTISDEISSFNIAAKLAGYDWSEVVRNAGYYGIGYLFLYAPLFRILKDPILIYRIIVAGSAVLLGLTGIVCYRTLERFFRSIPQNVSVAISVACGCLSLLNTYNASMRNEEMLLLVSWLLLYNLAVVLTEEKAVFHKLAIIFLCIYALTLHTRAMIYIVALLMVCAAYRVIMKKKLMGLIYWAVLAGGYFLSDLILNLYKNSVWTGDNAIRNASLQDNLASGFMGSVLSLDYVKSLFYILFGQLYTAFTSSFGAFVIAFIAVIFIIVVVIFRKKIIDNEEKIIVWGGSFLALNIMGTVAGQCLTWGDNVYYGIIRPAKEWVYGFKAFTYMRYPGCFMPPIILLGLIVLYKYRQYVKQIMNIMLALVLGLSVFWYYCIHPYIKGRKESLFLPSIMQLPNTAVSENVWLFSIQLTLLIALVWMILINRKRGLLWLCVLTAFYTSTLRFYGFMNEGIINEQKRYLLYDKGYKVMDYLKEQDYLHSGDSIYVYDAVTKSDHQVWYLYQYMEPDIKVLPYLPEDTEGETLLFTNSILPEKTVEDMHCIRLDDNEVFYYSGSTIEKIMSQYLGE